MLMKDAEQPPPADRAESPAERFHEVPKCSREGERERLADRMGGESWVAQWRVGERQCHAREVSAGEPVQLSNCDVAGEEERKSGREGARLGRAQCSGSNSSWAQ